jgi:hypothetical protein
VRPTRQRPPGGRLRCMQTIDSPPPAESSVHVVPGRKGSWSVRTDADPVALSMHPSTTEAEWAAHRVARARGARRVIVHDRYGRLHTVTLVPRAAD